MKGPFTWLAALCHRGVVLSTQGVQNLRDTALTLTVLEINDIFQFHPIFKMAAKSRKSKKISISANIQDGGRNS